MILAAALLSLFKVFNGNFVAASRLLFAMGRRGLVDRPHWRGPSPQSDALIGGAAASVLPPRRACFWGTPSSCRLLKSVRWPLRLGWPGGMRGILSNRERHRASAAWRLSAAPSV